MCAERLKKKTHLRRILNVGQDKSRSAFTQMQQLIEASEEEIHSGLNKEKPKKPDEADAQEDDKDEEDDAEEDEEDDKEEEKSKHDDAYEDENVEDEEEAKDDAEDEKDDEDDEEKSKGDIVRTAAPYQIPIISNPYI